MPPMRPNAIASAPRGSRHDLSEAKLLSLLNEGASFTAAELPRLREIRQRHLAVVEKINHALAREGR